MIVTEKMKLWIFEVKRKQSCGENDRIELEWERMKI